VQVKINAAVVQVNITRDGRNENGRMRYACNARTAKSGEKERTNISLLVERTNALQ